MMSRISLLLVLVLAARADADPKAEAKQHIKKAMAFHGEGKLAESLDELTLAYALDPQPDVLYAIGQVHIQLGDCMQAISFYERFLASKPPPKKNAAAAAREAIRVCKTNPPKPPEPKVETKPEAKPEEPKPEPEVEPKPEEPNPEPKVEPKVETKPANPDTEDPVFKKHTKRTGHAGIERVPQPERPDGGGTPFYKDVIGDVLVGGGVVAGALGVMFYVQMRGKLDDAENAPTYDEHDDSRAAAASKRNLALGFGAGAVVLVGAGIARYILRDDGSRNGGVAIAPTTDGGVVTFMGRF